MFSYLNTWGRKEMDAVAKAVAWLGERSTAVGKGNRFVEVLELGGGLIVGKVKWDDCGDPGTYGMFWDERWEIIPEFRGKYQLDDYTDQHDVLFWLDRPGFFRESRKSLGGFISMIRRTFEPVVEGVAFYDEPRPLPDIYPVGPV